MNHHRIAEARRIRQDLVDLEKEINRKTTRYTQLAQELAVLEYQLSQPENKPLEKHLTECMLVMYPQSAKHCTCLDWSPT